MTNMKKMRNMKNKRIKASILLLGIGLLWNFSAVPVDTDQEVVAIVRESIYYESAMEEEIQQADAVEEAIYAYIPQVTLTD